MQLVIISARRYCLSPRTILYFHSSTSKISLNLETTQLLNLFLLLKNITTYPVVLAADPISLCTTIEMSLHFTPYTAGFRKNTFITTYNTNIRGPIIIKNL